MYRSMVCTGGRQAPDNVTSTDSDRSTFKGTSAGIENKEKDKPG